MNKYLRALAIALCLIGTPCFLASSAHAQQTVITSNTTIAGRLSAGISYEYVVDDGVTLTFEAPASSLSGGLYSMNNNSTFTVRPAGSTGRVVFHGAGTPGAPSIGVPSATKQGGALFLNTGKGNFTNATFENYWAIGQGGAIYVGTGNPTLMLKNTVFQNNGASVNGGAIMIGLNAVVTIDSSTFASNRADGYAVTNAGVPFGGNGGAIAMWANAGAQSLTATNVVFTGNSAAGSGGKGGAIYARTGKSLLINPNFTDNKAANIGGAIAIDSTQNFTIDVTKDAAYTGNMAFSNTLGTFTTGSSTGGGFLYIDNASTQASINIAGGKTLTIGSAANTVADTIASGNSANTLVINAGGGNSTLTTAQTTGTLILHGASTNISASSTVAIANGTVLLGNSAAALSGKINVAAPATFGGVGTIASSSTVTLANGATLQVGTATTPNGMLGIGNGVTTGAANLTGSGVLAGNIALGGDLTANITASANDPLSITAKLSGAGNIIKTGNGMIDFESDNSLYLGNITVNAGIMRMAGTGTLGGNVSMNAGSTLYVSSTMTSARILGNVALTGARVLYNNEIGTNALNVGGLNIGTGNFVQLTKLASGTYTLFNSTAPITASGTLGTLYKGVAVSGRTVATYTGIGGNALVLNLAVTSAQRTWNAAANSSWGYTEQNWVEADKLYQDGDTVIFGGLGTAAPITIASAGVIVSEMQVNGAGNYTFAGGSITGDNTAWQGGTNVATGKLLKAGSGTLTFANASNNFEAGIDISGGAISFTNAAQLGTLNDASVDQGITFSGNGALVSATNNLTFANALNIGAGATATLDTQGNTLTYSGRLAPATATSTLQKSGSGALNVTADNSSYTGATKIDAGTLNLSGRLGGAIAVNSGATLGGTGTATGSVTANAGSRIRIGDATSTAAQNLTINGALALNNATVAIKTYSTTSDTITAGSLAFSGNNTFDFSVMLESGTHTLIKTTSGITGFNAADIATFQSGSLFVNDRVDKNYKLDGNNLTIELLFANRNIAWNGSIDGNWLNSYGNWQGGAEDFLGGDAVTFDGITDASHTGNRTITVDSNGVRVADMNVTGAATYKFIGGSISSTPNTTIATSAGRLNKNGTGTVILENAPNNFSGGIAVNTGTLVGNATSLAANTVTVAAPAILVINQTTDGNFAGTATGAGTVAKTGAATLSLSATAAITAKTFNINEGVFSVTTNGVNVDTLNVNPGATLALNAGTLRATTLNLGANGTLASNWSVAITTPTFNHAGALRIGTAADAVNAHQALTIIGNYVGQGGTLSLNTIFDTGVTDQLIINGNASGHTLLDISHPTMEMGAPTTGLGIKIVGITGTDDLDLAFAHRANTGVYDYQIYHDVGGIFLRSNLSSEVMTGNAAPAVAMLAGRASLDTIQNRLGEIRLDPARISGLWMRDTYRSDTLQKSWLSDVEVDTNVIQVGADHAFINPNGTPDNWILGAYYTRTDAKGKMTDGSQLDNTANGGGVYAIFKRGAFYIEALAKADFIDSTVNAPYSYMKTKGTIIGGSLEAGWNLDLKRWGTLEPQAQVSYQYIKLETGSDNQYRQYSYDAVALPTVRGGVRWHKDFKVAGILTPWLRGSVAYDCKGDYATTIRYRLGNGAVLDQTRTFDNELGGPRYIIDGGVTWQCVEHWSVYLSGGIDTAPKSEGWTASAGVRFAW